MASMSLQVDHSKGRLVTGPFLYDEILRTDLGGQDGITT